MIQGISVRNFKSFREAELTLAPLTLLVGANASGKSNFLEAIRLLTWLARGRRLDEILSAVQEEDQQIRGTIDSLTHPSGDEFAIGCHINGDRDLRLEVTIRVTSEGLRIVAESLTTPSEKLPLYRVIQPAGQYTHEIQVEYNNFARGGIKPRISCTDQQAVFTQLETPARFSGKAERLVPQEVKRCRENLEHVLFLDPSPRRMRQYSFINDRQLKADGSNLSSVLHQLTEQGHKDDILQFIRALPEQDITDLSFLRTQRNEVMLRLEESFGGKSQTWDAPVLSDGTLRVLAVAAALISAPEGSLVIIEEIDNGVHPSRADLLLRNILTWATHRKLSVLLTAHNPALLDALPVASVPDVAFCYRDRESGDSTLRRIETMDSYPQLVAQGPLGEVMTQGILDRMAKDPRSAAQKKEQALDWLDRLEEQVASR